jgi:5-methylcytosine-specific restriction endonuclease McrA
LKKRLLDFWYGQIIARLWQMKRRFVLWRDRGHCKYCYEKLTAKTFTIDHIVPVSAGGSNAFDNLVACCKYCNKMKADKPADTEMRNKMWMAAYRRAEHNTPRRRVRNL